MCAFVTVSPEIESHAVRSPTYRDGAGGCRRSAGLRGRRIAVIRRSALTWLLMIPVAIANGTLREVVLNPLIRDFTARQISVVTGSAAFLVLVYLMMRNYVRG